MESLIIKLLLGAITGLIGCIGILWKWSAGLREETRQCLEEIQALHEKRIEDLKQHSRDSELFLRKLAKLQASDSNPPSSAA